MRDRQARSFQPGRQGRPLAGWGDTAGRGDPAAWLLPACAPPLQLPSVITLAADYEVAVPTVRKALSLLKAEGLVTGVASYGRFVAEKQ
jgi:Bacterial regulatory proteins, gntR family